uniref:Uncharacterized protein n=1 Tax=Anopheles albimanus TaxID=7167 RepID=A0A182FXP6_ANOAL
MRSFRLESVLIGHIVDGVHLAIIGGEGVRAAHHQCRVLVVELLELGLLLPLDSVARVELEVVTIEPVVIVVVLQHLGILLLGSRCRQHARRRHESHQQNDR